MSGKHLFKFEGSAPVVNTIKYSNVCVSDIRRLYEDVCKKYSHLENA